MLCQGKYLLVLAVLFATLIEARERTEQEIEAKKARRNAKLSKIVANRGVNDDAIYMTAQEILKRSGFGYEEYYVLGDDGYITQLVRIVSPLVDRSQLKKPPVLLYHGANVDMTSYLFSSSLQHHPEKYPRNYEQDGPITSSNRSLAFTLANNGFDVWLIGSRGSNDANRGYIRMEQLKTSANPQNKNFQFDEKLLEFSKTKEYWQYGLDEIIAYDIRNQIDKVREVTGTREFNLFSFSLSTPTTLAFLGANPDYARDVKLYIQMGPAINADHFTAFSKIYFEVVCPLFPTRGIGFTPTFSLKSLIRKLIIRLSRSFKLTYSLIFQVMKLLFGPNELYESDLERNALSHIFMPVSFKSVQQYCQGSVSKKLTKFDYGDKKNLELYGSKDPPAYKVDFINVQNYAVVYGTKDTLASPETVDKLETTVSSPNERIEIKVEGFNHYDLLGGVDVDTRVNLPIIELFSQHSSQ